MQAPPPQRTQWRREFVIGVVGWVALNVLLFGLSLVLRVNLGLIAFFLNVAALVYFGFTRPRVAFGALAILSLVLFFMLIVATLLGSVCFTLLYQTPL
jgi:hypothetical protein